MGLIRNPMCTTDGEINIVSRTGPINISTEAAQNILTLGNNTLGSSVVINTGTTGLIATSTGPILLDADGSIDLNSSAAAINIGNDAVAQPVNIGTGAAVRVVTIGNDTGASSIVLDVGSAGLSVPSFAATGALVSDAAGKLTNAAGASAGQVLMANGVGSVPTFQSISGSGTVNSGIANQLTYYDTTGDAVSGLTGANSAMVVTSSTGVPAMTASMTNGQIVIGSTSATPVPATITAGAGITVTNGPGSITIDSTGGSGATWTSVTGTSATMVAGDGYISNNAALVTLTLPATADVGSLLYIQGYGAGGWRVAQGAGQQVFIGSTSSTVGASGSTSSVNRYDSMTLVCVSADTVWCALGGPLSAGLDVV